jgi:hypothetical protein
MSDMGTTTNQASQRSGGRRLDSAGQGVNGLVATLRNAPDEVKGRMGRRVDSLRAQEAELRTRLRALREADQAADVAELDPALAQLEDEIDIAEAELDAELAGDEEAFAAAVTTELEAWDRRLDRLEARTAATGQPAGATAIQLVRERRADAGRELARFRTASSEASAALRAGMRQAIEDLDWAAQEAAATFDTPRRSK